MPTNEEYMQRWEAAAPTPIEVERSPDEIQKRAEASRSTTSYDDDIMGREDPAMLEAMAEYASRVSDAEPSNQTKEELARVRESSMNAAQEYVWLSPEEYKNEGDRMGKIMHGIVFLNTLRKAGVKCWFRDHPQQGKITLIVQRENLLPEVGCWCQIGYAPELSVMRFDDHGVPLAEKYRGWRTCLLQLILKSVISEKKAEEVFGKPPTTQPFHRYNATLRSFRNNGNRLEN